MCNNYMGNKKAFTLVETFISTFIVLYVFLAAWMLYSTAWAWWHEISPKIEAQKTAKLALSLIITGSVDDTAGVDIINSVNYKRRNGIAWASSLLNPTSMPDDDGDGEPDRWLWTNNRIDFRLEGDVSSDLRYFKVENNKIVYCYSITRNGVLQEASKDIVRTSDPLDAIALEFEFVVQYNMVKVTVTIAKHLATRPAMPYTITLKDYIHMRNL